MLLLAYFYNMQPAPRNEILRQLSTTTFDVLVIGGGITGAGIALDAAARGLKVCLLEKYDFASGTSSRSTKLIHGGLRYLKQLEFGLVRTVGKERAVIFKNAPQLVRPVQMLLPIYKNGSLGKWSTAMALWIYDLLAGVLPAERFRMLSARQTARQEPLLHTHGLLGAALYTEYRTDDARLTIETIKTAQSYGAVCINYCYVHKIIYEKNHIQGVQFLDLMTNQEGQVQAKLVVSAAGPWVDEVRLLDGPLQGKSLRLTKGVHLVVDGARLPIQQPVYVDVPGDSRMIFVIPRNQVVYIGTTDTMFDGSTDLPLTSLQDVSYLLQAVNSTFPGVDLKVADILSSWAGIRPLIHQAGKKPSELSRKDEIIVSPSGLISIAGGKLTGYRSMAQKVVNRIATTLKKQYGISSRPCATESLHLSGWIAAKELDAYLINRMGESTQVGFDSNDIQRLVMTYGSGTEWIIERAFDLYNVIPDKTDRLLTAELEFTVACEMVCNLSDFLIRRTGLLYFNRPYVVQHYRRIAELLSGILQQTPEEMQHDMAFFEAALEQAVDFR
jgi:glycerol-3-phosphate dehydrogenase